MTYPRNEHGRFIKGGPGGPGRPKGCKQYFPRGDRRFLEKQLRGLYDQLSPIIAHSLWGDKRACRSAMNLVLRDSFRDTIRPPKEDIMDIRDQLREIEIRLEELEARAGMGDLAERKLAWRGLA